jgi:protein-tyrosine phosphatase
MSASLLFVCTGNICRSPTAEGVARALAARHGVDCELESAGIGAWHVGEAPDTRTINAASTRGYDLSNQRARQLAPGDFDRFDHIIALDAGHLRQLHQMAPDGGKARLSLLMDWSDRASSVDVPDPYYGDREDFDQVIEMVEEAIEGLFASLYSNK